MTMLRLSPVPTSRLTWHAASRSYVAEISDLGGRFHRLYDDACDEGLALQGRSGEATFHVAETHTDAEGDVTHWTLRPTPETLRRLPFLAAVRVLVYND
jgi:hypothetical protein